MSLISESDLRKILNIKEDEWKWLITIMSHFLHIERLNQIYSEYNGKSGHDFIDFVLNKLNIKYSVQEDFQKQIPSSGPFIIIANHPLGVIDGLLLLKLICEIRPDFKLQGNFLLQNIEPVRNFILPVNPFEDFKSARSSYKGIRGAWQHLEQGNSLGIFPAGEVSSYHLKDFKVTDRQWQRSSVQFIQKAGVPVIPVHFQGYNSTLFYLLGQLHPLLRTAKLPSELFNKSKQTIKIQIRKPISSKTINSFTSVKSLTHYLRAKTYSIHKNKKPSTIFKSGRYLRKEIKKNIIEPVDFELIYSDLLAIKDEHFLFSQGSFSAYCAPFSAMPNIMQEIGRLREITFREIGEGTNNSVDLDRYDLYYDHLIIWDDFKNQLVGSYRLGRGNDIVNQFGKKGFYISSLFKIKKGFNSILQKSVELGRSFIVKEYQRQPLSLFLLWKGILWYLIKNPGYEYLIGPVSISNDFSKRSKSLIVQFVRKNYFDHSLSEYIKPRKKFMIPKKLLHVNNSILEDIDENIRTLNLYISEFQPELSMPVLMKKYLQLNGKIIGFNIDPGFNNCLDALMMVNISKIPYEMFDNLLRELEENQIKGRFRKASDLIPKNRQMIYNNTSA